MRMLRFPRSYRGVRMPSTSRLSQYLAAAILGCILGLGLCHLVDRLTTITQLALDAPDLSLPANGPQELDKVLDY